jgi:hypothetical protein
MDAKFEELEGVILKDIRGFKESSDELLFIAEDGRKWKMNHSQDCCESVNIEDICGDLKDIIGSPILLAEESTSRENPPDAKKETTEYQDSFTWTFYKLSTIKGSVTIRWYGESNGYYSESVDFYKIN